MKHLYKTKEGEILEAKYIDFTNKQVCLSNGKLYGQLVNLSDVQEVVLDKDGEPFMFEGEVVCVGDEVNGEEILDFIFCNRSVILRAGKHSEQLLFPFEFKGHTPKHPQKKGIEKIDNSECLTLAHQQIVDKLNQLIDEVNKLKQ